MLVVFGLFCEPNDVVKLRVPRTMPVDQNKRRASSPCLRFRVMQIVLKVQRQSI